jgi:asparagine synthase (glutamine-hydrolysing)
MPGLSVRYSPDRTLSTPAASERFRDALSAVEHRDDYRSALLRGADSHLVGACRYPQYPLEVVEDDTTFVAFEGHVHDRALSAADLLELAGDCLATPPDRGALRSWLARTDGAFLCCAVHKPTGRLALLDDVFGRLPVYYRETDEGLVASRDVHYVLDAAPDPRFDRVGLAQVLTFAYTLGHRTLWDDVRTLPPGTLVRVGPDGGRDQTRLFAFDFGDRRYAGRSRERNAAELASLFRCACRDRDDTLGPTVLSLSGGHDSRALAAAFHAEGRPFRAATFRRHDDQNGADVDIAGRVADALGVDWREYDVPPVTTDAADRLLDLKAGLNHVGMGYVLDFLESVRDDYGPDAAYYTGDGGDKTMPDLSPPRSFDGLSDLVDYVVSRNSVFPPRVAADLVGIDHDALVDSVASTLASYPESDGRDRYVHFLTHERGFNWLFEGEDRNRHYLWSTSPFYSTPFYRYAMNVPDEQKARDALYQSFLDELWPRATAFDAADFAVPMDSFRYTLVQYGLETLARHPGLEDAARVVYRGELGSRLDSHVAALFREQLSCDAVERHFTPDRLRTLARERDAGAQQAFLLLTLTAAVDRQCCHRRTTDRLGSVALE